MKIRNVIRAIKQKFGTLKMKRALWDSEYGSGKWDHCKETPWDDLYARIAKHGHGGRVLDLGCGPGATARELSEVSSLKEYVGVDVSFVALQEATAVMAPLCKPYSFELSDISRYNPVGMFSVILLRESIYYLPDPVGTLKKFSAHLLPDGVMIVTVNNGVRYNNYLTPIRSGYEVLEEPYGRTEGSTMIVFKNRSAKRAAA